ncbi:MAG: carbohydrate-binding protein, partial [Firmicutes bacterium]|nr:carbohydrate-binding protein [Bacillota bacterium]
MTVLGMLLVFQAAALDNGLAKTPPMGWNSWNCFHENINETQIKQIADAMVSSGMRDAGYIYLNLDDNWMANPARDASGNLRADPSRFPSGMKALGDYIHSKGLKFGIYGDRGTMTCAGVPQSGSYGNEQRDANTFASWGVDYLKYDNCNAVGNMQTDYTNMKNALASCGRPIVFSICAWQFQSWMPATGNLWRVSEDIIDTWDNGSSWGKGIIECIDANRDLASYAKPGAWNDPDMLEIGNGGCTTEEYRTQMSMWSIMAAPLIAGNDIRNMSQATRDILLNSEVIAVDQDPAGIQGTRISASGGLEVWCKPLGMANGTTKAVALLNRNGSAANITVNFASIGLSGTVTVRDLWAKADRGSFSGSYTMSVPAHGTGMLKLTSGSSASPTPTPASGPRSAFSQIEAESFNSQSGVQTESCGEGGQNIGYIENGDYVVYNNVDFGGGA